VKKSSLEEDAIKALMYGGIRELMHNRKYYYYSTVGSTYSHWTDEGKEALNDYMNIIGYKILEAEERALDKRAKELVIKGLKGEKI
jgi:hypothetical protein